MFLEKQINTHLVNLTVYQNRIPISPGKTLDLRKNTNHSHDSTAHGILLEVK